MDVKPWDDETDMEALEKAVRSVEQDGLVWGGSKLVAIGYGIKKLQITLVVGMYIIVADSCTNQAYFTHRGRESVHRRIAGEDPGVRRLGPEYRYCCHAK